MASGEWAAMLSKEQQEALARVRAALFVPAEERSHFERQAPAVPGSEKDPNGHSPGPSDR